MKTLFFIGIFLLIVTNIHAQNLTDPIDTMYVHFNLNSVRLKKGATFKLDSLKNVLAINPQLGVKTISSAKDLCDKCGTLAWDRTKKLVKRLDSHGTYTNQIISSVILEGENDRIQIIIGNWKKMSAASGFKK